MRTFISEYDLNSPSPFSWGTHGCSRADILIRSGEVPLGVLRLPIEHWRVAFSAWEIEHAAERQLGISSFPVLRLASIDQLSTLPPISVIVCTRDRPRSLGRCLSSLAKLLYPQYEIIVVDNASLTDETRETASKFTARYVKEVRPGLDWARNKGLNEARYDIVAYTDDDVQVDRYWLRGLARGFNKPETAAVTGLVLPLEIHTPAQHLFEQYGGMSKGFRPKYFSAQSLSDLERITVQNFGLGANMAFRRKIIEDLGFFDTALDVGTPSQGAGDLDMFSRLLAAGNGIRYEPSALVWHQHRRDLESLRQQLHANGRAYGVYLIKRWRTKEVPARAVISYVSTRWAPWLFGRLILKMLGRHRMPIGLLLAELLGALLSPVAYIKTYHHDKNLKEKHSGTDATAGIPRQL